MLCVLFLNTSLSCTADTHCSCWSAFSSIVDVFVLIKIRLNEARCDLVHVGSCGLLTSTHRLPLIRPF